MNGETLIGALKVVARSSGLPASTAAAPWSIFAAPFWRQGEKVGFHVLFHRGIDPNREHATRGLLDYALAVDPAAGTHDLCGLLQDAFSEDVCGVFASGMAPSIVDLPPLANLRLPRSILASGRLLRYAVVRVDTTRTGEVTIHYRHDRRPSDSTAWAVDNIERIEASSTRVTVLPSGSVMREGAMVGNWRTGQPA